MSIANERSASLLQAQFRALHVALSQRNSEFPEAPNSQILTLLMRHGGLYTLLDRDMMTARLVPMLSGQSGMTVQSAANFVESLGSAVASFFIHLKPASYYVLDSSLISHLSFPGPDSTGKKPRGLTFTPDMPTQPPGLESPSIPAAFTFVGQFIDHDLTMNAVDLFNPQTGEVQNTASPLIDLDCVYGPRTILFNAPAHGSIYSKDGTFKLEKKEGGPFEHFYDLPRHRGTHKAYISDARNDENQMILQVHLMVMKLHNKLLTTVYKDIEDPLERFQKARIETIYNWQSMIIDDFLPRTLRDDVLQWLLEEIAKKDFGDFKYKPLLDLSTHKYVASLPHEFAIGFRYGHSQLKPKYLLRGDQVEGITLFDNSLVADRHGNFEDLRGTQPLIAKHVIDWEFFAGGKFKGNLIDGKVTSVVFDLPESTIPDDIKFIGNLVQRNLIRSSQVGLCSGEELAKFYGFEPLSPDQIDPDPNARGLYVARDSNGNVQMRDGHDVFQTPLWYYLLKEAELEGGKTKGSLGRLGSRLVGEVVLGAIAWADESVFRNGHKDVTWKSQVPLEDPDKVTLLDLARFVADY
jgi:hypothetical protein